MYGGYVLREFGEKRTNVWCSPNLIYITTFLTFSLTSLTQSLFHLHSPIPSLAHSHNQFSTYTTNFSNEKKDYARSHSSTLTISKNDSIDSSTRQVPPVESVTKYTSVSLYFIMLTIWSLFSHNGPRQVKTPLSK